MASKTVKPAGGGDYTTLAAWWAGESSATTGVIEAQCYGGGDCGVINIASMGGTPGPTHYAYIHPAAGEEHAGVYSSSKARIDQSGSGVAVTMASNYAVIRRMQLRGLSSGGCNGILTSSTNNTVDGCLIPPTVGHFDSAIIPGTAAGNQFTIINNILNGSCFYGIPFVANVLNYSGCLIANNTLVDSATDHQLFIIDSGLASGSVTIKNNIVTGSTTNYAGSAVGVTITASNNASSDATGDDFGASGSLINQVASNLFVNPAGADFTLKAGSNAINAGADLSGTFTIDAIGMTRPQGSAFDMGALELFVPNPEIAVSLSGSNIADGETTPQSFGSIVQGGATVSKTFKVDNTGTSTLTISSVTVPTGFTITTSVVGTIAAGGTANLIVRLDSATLGSKTGDITINSDDSDEAAFNFAVSGTIILPAGAACSMLLR